MKNSNTIVDTLVRVKLTIGGGGSTATARELSEELASAHGTDSKSIATSVKWLAPEYRKRIDGAASVMRAGFNSRTLPWEDGGFRVVPADRYRALLDFVAEHKAAYEQACAAVANNWHDVMEDARKRLNGALNKVRLPTMSEWQSTVRVDLDINTVTSPNDMRVTGLTDAQVTAIRDQAGREYSARITEGVRQIGQQLCDLLNDLIQRTEKDKQDGVRYGGWAEWARRTVAMSRPLNITGDKAIEELLRGVESLAAGIDPDTLRGNGAARRKAVADAKAALKVAAGRDDLDTFGIK